METDHYEGTLRVLLDDIRKALEYDKASRAIREVEKAYFEASRKYKELGGR